MKKQRMKSKLILVIEILTTVLACNASVWAGATGISMISQSHHVEGYHEIYDNGYVVGRDEYSYTDTVPVSGSASGIGEFGYPGVSTSSAGNFSLDAYHSIDAAMAIATSTYLFVPDSQYLSIVIDGYVDISHGLDIRYENDVHFRFSDVTAGIELDYYTADDYYNWPHGNYWLNWEQEYSLNPEHQYELYLYVREGESGEGFWGNSWLNIELISAPSKNLLQPIPAPGALMLGSMGVGFVSWLRRRRTL